MRVLSIALSFIALLCAGLAMAQPYENPSVVGQVPDRVLVLVKSGVKMNLDKSGGDVLVGVPGLDNLSKRFDVHNMEPLYAGLTNKLANKADVDELDRIWAVDFDAGMGLKNVMAAYENLPEVELVMPVDICRTDDAYLPDDVATSQWYLRNTNLGGADVRAVGAWNQALGDSNIVVAVVDSGVDWHHPDLGGSHPDKVNGAVWTNWAEYYGTPGVDDDSNGRVDDIRGWDFVATSASQGWPDEDVTVADNDPMDYGGHGTMVAGCIAPITNNGIGVAATAPGCKVMALRAGYLPNGETQGIVRMDWVSQAFLYAVGNGASVINLSAGSSSTLSFSVQAAQNAGVLIVTSAGNDNDTAADYLSTRSGVLSVAATTSTDGKSSFSSYGTWVEISAPGSEIYTTYYNRFDQSSTYTTTQGTSFSSPIVAGCAALVWSANPTWTYQMVSQALTNNCDDIDEINPQYAGLLGAGRVNILRSLGDTQNRYPEEFPTIFDAINCATDGFTVAIEGGISLDGPMTVIGRDVEVLGGFSSDYGSRDPMGNPTTIQGTSGNSVLKFFGNVEQNTVVDGFHITGGSGLNFSGIPYTGYYGGGILVQNVSPTLRNLTVTGNGVGNNSDLGCGGGIMINNSNAYLENVHVHGNTGIYGAGMIINNATPTLVDCIIEDNDVITDNLSFSPLGGGLHIVDSAVTMVNCAVRGHTDCTEGGGIYSTDGSVVNMTGGEVNNNKAVANGGGIYQSGGSLTLHGTTVNSNTNLPTSTFMNGGGIYATAASVAMDSVMVASNYGNAGGGLATLACPQVDVSNSVFTDNTGQFFGGAILLQSNTAGTITGNTIVANEGTFSGGAGLHATGTAPEMSNNIFAFNSGAPSFANGVSVPGEPAVFSCNDVFSNVGADFSGMADPTGTNGNIMADPLFCNLSEGELNLTTASPCAPGNSGGCGLIGALAASCGGESPVPDSGEVPVAFRVEQNYPNPFNPSTTIRFALPAEAPTEVVIFDLAGRKVKTLVNDVMAAQVHDVVWTGRDDADRAVAAGVYFYRVTSGDHLSVGRMALVK